MPIKETISEEKILNVKEAAAFLKVKPDTIYAWVHQRLIPYRKHGSRLVFSKRELEAWSEAQAVRPAELNEETQSGTRKEVSSFFDKTHNSAADPEVKGSDDE